MPSPMPRRAALTWAMSLSSLCPIGPQPNLTARKPCPAHADEPDIGMDLDDQRLLAAVAAFVDIGQTQVDGFDTCDLHGLSDSENVLGDPYYPGGVLPSICGKERIANVTVHRSRVTIV